MRIAQERNLSTAALTSPKERNPHKILAPVVCWIFTRSCKMVIL